MSATDAMRKVLFVSFRFPPHGGGGVQRGAYFARYLAEHGWNAHVLTGPLNSKRRLEDASLLEVVPGSVGVTRTGAINTKRLFQLLARLHLAGAVRASTPSLPQMEGGWIPWAYRAGAKLVEEQQFDAILSTATPIASHLVALLLKRKTGLPWVADYRDEWSQRAIYKWPTALHHELAERIDGWVTGNADRVITTSPAHTSSFSEKFPSHDSGKYVTVTNGYDDADFMSINGTRPGHSKPGRFQITYVGSVFSYYRPEPFLRAVERLVDRGDIPGDEIVVNFVGNSYEFGFESLQRRGILVRKDYVDHREAINWMRDADVLLLLNDGTNIPGKTFEYLAARRPILAIVRESPAADVVRGAEAGIVASPDDDAAIESALRRLYDSWVAGELADLKDRSVVRRYSRRQITRQLARILDEVTGQPQGVQARG